jgi:bifunctional enzyme CysN/CysC
VQAEEFVEIFVDTPIEVAEERDPKGLYKKARRGEIKRFTGIDSPYEIPEDPELRIVTTQYTAEEAADSIIDHLVSVGVVWTQQHSPESSHEIADAGNFQQSVSV